MSLTLYQASVRRTESKAVEWAQRTLSQTIVLGLLYSNDPVRGPRLARWEEIARLRLRQLRGLPISRQDHLACAYADRQKWSWIAAHDAARMTLNRAYARPHENRSRATRQAARNAGQRP